MKLITSISNVYTVAMAAGTNRKDITVPAGYCYKVRQLGMYNIDAGNRVLQVWKIYPDGTLFNIGSYTYAATKYVNGWIDGGGYLKSDMEWVFNAGETIRFEWLGMTGGNNAICHFTGEVYRI